jgi:hypothetical protein
LEAGDPISGFFVFVPPIAPPFLQAFLLSKRWGNLPSGCTDAYQAEQRYLLSNCSRSGMGWTSSILNHTSTTTTNTLLFTALLPLMRLTWPEAALGAVFAG